MKKKIETYKRKTLFSELKQFDVTAKENDFIEVTEWFNGEGFDVEVSDGLNQRFQMTFSTFDALKKLVNKLDENE